MLQIDVQPLFHFFAHLYLIAQVIIFAAVLTMMLPRKFAVRATRKLVLANSSARNRKTNLTGYSKRRNF